MRQTLRRIPPAPRTVLVSRPTPFERAEATCRSWQRRSGGHRPGRAVASPSRAAIGVDAARRVPMRSTMSLVAVWEAGADSHQPSTAQAVADQGRPVSGRRSRSTGQRSHGSRSIAQAVDRINVDRRRSRGSGPWSLGVITRQEADLEVIEGAVVDAGADVVNQPDDESLVVDRAER